MRAKCSSTSSAAASIRCSTPVRGAGIVGVAKWILQPQYGRTRQEIAEAVIAEWLREGAPTPETWTGLWFGLPRSYAPEQ